MEAADLDAMVPVALAHFTEVHPEFGLREANVRDYLEAEDRLSPVKPRLEDIGSVEIHPATPERMQGVLGFFDHEGFAGKPEWAACYCVAHHVGEGGPDWCRARNRAMLADRIEQGTTTGLLAYADGRVAAWCNASPRSAFIHYAGRDDLDDAKVGSIVCFVVAPPYRRHGLAVKLLDAACRSFADRGFTVAEAYPNKQPRDDASAYHGPLSMYLAAGFKEIGPLDEHLTVVQKELTPSTPIANDGRI
jgi:GNAT superfamily N-acetyltransferase